jgi:signal transduction histidine kinase
VFVNGEIVLPIAPIHMWNGAISGTETKNLFVHSLARPDDKASRATSCKTALPVISLLSIKTVELCAIRCFANVRDEREGDGKLDKLVSPLGRSN